MKAQGYSLSSNIVLHYNVLSAMECRNSGPH